MFWYSKFRESDLIFRITTLSFSDSKLRSAQYLRYAYTLQLQYPIIRRESSPGELTLYGVWSIYGNINLEPATERRVLIRDTNKI